MEITGISLQILAGLVFILDQIAHKFSTSIEKWVGGAVTFVTGKTKRRWRIVILFSLVALPVIFIALAKLGTNEEITWATIVGILIFTVIGFDSYALLLIIVGKRTLRGNITQHINSLIEDGKLVSVNVIVLVISCILLAGISIIMVYVQPKIDNIVLQTLLAAPLLMGLFIFLPAVFFSLFFLLSEGFIRFIYSMGKIRPAYYWIAILILWVAGGGFLLANALCS
jgi:hypothetical protein